MMVAWVWSKHRLQPHRLERYMSSKDPDFNSKHRFMSACYSPLEDPSVLRIMELT